MKEYTRVPKTCPFCKQNPFVKIQEVSDRIDNVEYIRHFNCPYCGKKVELRMLEYFHPVNGFQRNVSVRKIRKQEDNEIKRKQRIVSISSQKNARARGDAPHTMVERSDKMKIKLGARARSRDDSKLDFFEKYKDTIVQWTVNNQEEIIAGRMNYSWGGRTLIECLDERNNISKLLTLARIKNEGGIDLKTLDNIMSWGGFPPFSLREEEEVLKLTRLAFGYVDEGNLKSAILELLKIYGIGISSASKIIGLFDQDSLAIYDSRVGTALRTLTKNGNRLLKCRSGRNRPGDTCKPKIWAENYEKFIWVLEIMRNYLNVRGYPFRIADVEMALFMIGK